MCRKYLADDAWVARLLLAASFVVVLSLLGSAVRANAELPQRAAPRIGIGQVSIDGQQGCAFGYRQSGMECRAFAVPPHAYITPEGDSWDCDRGFHAAATACVRISLPANAHLTDFSDGQGWECNRGYRNDGDTCRPVYVPKHAYPVEETMESDWECFRGYRRQGEGCVAVKVPTHGYLTAAGDDWQCDRGYFVKDGTICAPLRVPANAHIDASGSDWECDPGYSKSSLACTAIRVPAHAFAAYESDMRGWQCERGYMARKGECVPVEVPENAFLDESGHSWKCERGFAASGTGCVPIQLPANAHLDFTGNAWNCNWGFEAPGPPSRMAPCPHKGFLCNLCRTGAARAPAHGGSHDGCAVGMIAICWRLTRFGRDTVNAMASATSSDFSHSTCDLEPSSQSIAP